MKQIIPLLLVAALSGCGPSKAPVKVRRADREQTGQPARPSTDTHA